jgi:hypothetical protein
MKKTRVSAILPSENCCGTILALCAAWVYMDSPGIESIVLSMGLTFRYAVNSPILLMKSPSLGVRNACWHLETLQLLSWLNWYWNQVGAAHRPAPGAGPEKVG